MRRYQKGKTNLDFTEARDSEWQQHQLGHTQVCTSLQTDNHASRGAEKGPLNVCVCVKDENVKSENMKQNRDKNRTMYIEIRM